jgi:hypothetical protein
MQNVEINSRGKLEAEENLDLGDEEESSEDEQMKSVNVNAIYSTSKESPQKAEHSKSFDLLPSIPDTDVVA